MPGQQLKAHRVTKQRGADQAGLCGVGTAMYRRDRNIWSGLSLYSDILGLGELSSQSFLHSHSHLPHAQCSAGCQGNQHNKDHGSCTQETRRLEVRQMCEHIIAGRCHEHVVEIHAGSRLTEQGARGASSERCSNRILRGR